MIAAHRGQCSVLIMCRALQVSKSGFYAWQKRKPSDRAQENGALLVKIREVHQKYRRSYGSPRMRDELVDLGHPCSVGRVERLMRFNGIAAKPRKRFVTTTDSNHPYPIAENLLNREFAPGAANRVWASDITYVRTRQGWLYVAVTLDLFSRRVVGWATGSKIDAELAVRALQMAVDTRRPAKELIHHSDRGSQYASELFQEALDDHGMICSMSRRGNCWDNAPVESFFGSMKVEWLEEVYENRACAIQDVFEYVEIFYNRQRRHSTLGGISPLKFEELHIAA